MLSHTVFQTRVCVAACCKNSSILSVLHARPGVCAPHVSRSNLGSQLSCSRVTISERRHASRLASSSSETPAVQSEHGGKLPISQPGGGMTSFPNTAGVYALYDKEGTVQYIGLSRKVAMSIATHVNDWPEDVGFAETWAVADATKDNLTEAWRAQIQAVVEATGEIPAGNAPGETKWKARRVKPEIKLTPGKGLDDLNVPLEKILDDVVKSNKVVAFIKGTRSQPQCGFSHKVLTLLMEARTDFEVVNCLDDVYNPGLRETIKTYSQWPTIPQVYINGEFVGGADIMVEMAEKGELAALLRGEA